MLPGPLVPTRGRPPALAEDTTSGAPGRNLGPVSTRMLIILALLCGLAVLVAFAIQAAQIL